MRGLVVGMQHCSQEQLAGMCMRSEGNALCSTTLHRRTHALWAASLQAGHLARVRVDQVVGAWLHGRGLVLQIHIVKHCLQRLLLPEAAGLAGAVRPSYHDIHCVWLRGAGLGGQ